MEESFSVRRGILTALTSMSLENLGWPTATVVMDGVAHAVERLTQIGPRAGEAHAVANGEGSGVAGEGEEARLEAAGQRLRYLSQLWMKGRVQELGAGCTALVGDAHADGIIQQDADDGSLGNDLRDRQYWLEKRQQEEGDGGGARERQYAAIGRAHAAGRVPVVEQGGDRRCGCEHQREIEPAGTRKRNVAPGEHSGRVLEQKFPHRVVPVVSNSCRK
jgi:hypothetical protein